MGLAFEITNESSFSMAFPLFKVLLALLASYGLSTTFRSSLVEVAINLETLSDSVGL